MSFKVDLTGHAVQQDHVVYFAADTSVSSWAGHLDDQEDMPEDEVIDYIKSNDPELFEKLRGLPVTSRDIPMSFHGQRSLQRLNRLEVNRERVSATHAILKPADKPAAFRTNSSSTVNRALSVNRAQLIGEARERIKHKLNNGYALWHRITAVSGTSVPCNFALCSQQTLGQPKDLRLYTVVYHHQGSDLQRERVNLKNAEYFCCSCFPTIFANDINDELQAQYIKTTAQDQLLLDGVDHQTVVYSAAHLYPTISPKQHDDAKILDDCGRPDHAFNYPSNSSRNVLLREHKQCEIERTLAEVRRYEKATRIARTQHKQFGSLTLAHDTSVLITRPAYMEPKDERYKKQGLTSYDREKYVKEQRSSSWSWKTGTSSPLTLPLKSPKHLSERFCYCREHDDGTELLKCNARYCPIGWFHLLCTQLDRLPTINEQFFCYYCSDSLDERVTRVLLGSPTLIESTLIRPLVDTLSQRGTDPARIADDEETEGRCPKDDLEDRGDTDFGNSIRPVGGNRNLRGKIIKWVAVNDSRSIASNNVTQSTNSSSVEGDMDEIIPALSVEVNESTDDEHNDGISTPHLRPCNHSMVSDSSFSHRRSSSTLTPTRSDHPSDVETFSDSLTRGNTDAPVTPPLQSIYKSSKPWGTPVNMSTPRPSTNNLILEPASPSPIKRKISQVEPDVKEVVTEIADSDEDGEVVPLYLDERVSRVRNP